MAKEKLQRDIPFEEGLPANEEESPAERKLFRGAYHFGDVYDEGRREKDIKMCPSCKGAMTGKRSLAASTMLSAEMKILNNEVFSHDEHYWGVVIGENGERIVTDLTEAWADNKAKK